MALLRPLFIVEDDPDDLLLARMVFEGRGGGRPVHFSTDAQGALNALESSREGRYPALMIVDLNLPGMSGLELLQRLARHPRWRRIPVVVLSSSDLQTDRDASLTLGARACFRKPNGFRAFESMACEILAHAEAS